MSNNSFVYNSAPVLFNVSKKPQKWSTTFAKTTRSPNTKNIFSRITKKCSHFTSKMFRQILIHTHTHTHTNTILKALYMYVDIIFYVCSLLNEQARAEQLTLLVSCEYHAKVGDQYSNNNKSNLLPI